MLLNLFIFGWFGIGTEHEKGYIYNKGNLYYHSKSSVSTSSFSSKIHEYSWFTVCLTFFYRCEHKASSPGAGMEHREWQVRVVSVWRSGVLGPTTQLSWSCFTQLMNRRTDGRKASSPGARMERREWQIRFISVRRSGFLGPTTQLNGSCITKLMDWRMDGQIYTKRLALGRGWSVANDKYASSVYDDLVFWGRPLSSTEVALLNW